MKQHNLLCPATLTLGMISSRYKAHILSHIASQEEGMRFGELSRLVPEISRRMLSQSLKELVEDGFLERAEYPQIPPKVVYSLSDLGQKIQPVIQSLAHFGFQYMKDQPEKIAEVYGQDKLDVQLANAEKMGWT